jgi:serine/threonine protein kinase/outer membrane biosynthesis protein TonB
MMAERLGRYAVLKHLASGGMADVLIGRTEGIEGFERHVVLKRIRAEHAKDQRFMHMFLDEARVAANLHHQNIVQVFDIGEANGEYFFAMEYIHGEDLRKLLSAVSKTRKHMPLGLVCMIVSAAASGLHYAHERRDNNKKPLNIVHRDVSPSNILIGYDGAVKVADFGIAKATMRQVETRSGSLKGKVSYMSPEQCKGEDIDRRSDVFALGVVLYELATTTRLFKGDNDYLVMDSIVNARVPLPRVRRPDLPNELSAIIMKALSSDRQRRYANAEELRVALDQFAIKHNLAASNATLATFMRKIFGERPEPWLDNGPAVEVQPGVDPDGPTQAAGHSWTEMPRDIDAPITGEDGKTPTGSQPFRKSGGFLGTGAITSATDDTIPPPISTRETRTSMKLGWELSGNANARSKLMWLSVPLLALVGVGVWAMTRGDDTQTAAAAPSEPAAPAPVVAPTPAPAPPPPPTAPSEPPAAEVPTIRVAGSEQPTLAEPPVPAPAVAPEVAPVAKKTVKKPKVEAKSTPAAASPAPAAPAIVAAPAPAPAPPPVTPAVAPAPPAEEPKVIETVIPTLSNATVSAIASDHSRQLSACEGSSQLKGDVAVMFQVDGQGRVVKSQLSSSIKNPKVAGCILKAVQSWRFPKPPTGSAKGVYTISYQ